MDLMQKLTLLADSAKYDVACTSSGVDRRNVKGIGNAVAAGICHTFSADGRCVSLLKVLMSNYCVYNCAYCVNRIDNDVPRTAFTPEELAELTIQFYRRNYIEGLFLSSGVLRNPDYTMEQMIRVLEILRHEHHFWGYIHAKTIPGASPELVRRLGLVADRLSVNIELPSEASLQRIAPNKTKRAILAPMAQIREGLIQNKQELTLYRNAPKFAPAGQSTQMVIGATPESDFKIISLASGLYRAYQMRRVFYSAYIPISTDKALPALHSKPPLLREHRLYQADFLMRQYHFSAQEILTEDEPNLNPFLDPKCNWAIRNLHLFPVDVNTASLEELLRVPGIGPLSAERILTARRTGTLTLSGLKRIGVVLKRAQFFIRCGDLQRGIRADREAIVRSVMDPKALSFGLEQLSFFHAEGGLPPGAAGLAPENAVEEAVLCIAKSL